MKLKSRQLTASEESQKVIRCSLADFMVKDLSIPVLLFFKERLSEEGVRKSLQKALNAFPAFSGRIRLKGNSLEILCNNKGISYSTLEREVTLEEAMNKMLSGERSKLVELINAKRAIKKGEPLLTVRLSFFRGGGSCLGICWHHSIGDMHTFMYFLREWSGANSKEMKEGILVEERDEYLRKNMEYCEKKSESLRYLNFPELFKLAYYIATKAKKSETVQHYFTDEELANMKKEISKKCGKEVSTGNALCGHLFSIIASSDTIRRERYLSLAVNYRERAGLPKEIMGNMIDTINILFPPKPDPIETAKKIREGVDNYTKEHHDYLYSLDFVEKAKNKKWARFIPKALDPMRGNLLITSWAKFGVYDLKFEGAKLYYFSYVGEFPFPWFTTIVEGYENKGLICTSVLPSEVAAKLKEPRALDEIHQYRNPKEKLPEVLMSMEWVR